MNPYKILELREDATQEEVKAQYRKMSKVCHPDVGGDEGMFQVVNLAYRVLSNPKKRKLYDDTGVVDDESPNHVDNIIRSRMVDIAEKWLDNMLRGNKIALRVFALEGMQDATEKLTQANKDLSVQVDHIKNVAARLTCSGEDSIIHGVLENRVKTYLRGIRQNEQEIIVVGQLHTIMETYEYEEEVEAMVNSMRTIMGSPSMFANCGRVRFY